MGWNLASQMGWYLAFVNDLAGAPLARESFDYPRKRNARGCSNYCRILHICQCRMWSGHGSELRHPWSGLTRGYSVPDPGANVVVSRVDWHRRFSGRGPCGGTFSRGESPPAIRWGADGPMWNCVKKVNQPVRFIWGFCLLFEFRLVPKGTSKSVFAAERVVDPRGHKALLGRQVDGKLKLFRRQSWKVGNPAATVKYGREGSSFSTI